MTIEQLKAMLEAGEITEAVFKKMAAAIDPSYADTPKPEEDGANGGDDDQDSGKDPETDNTPLSKGEIDKLIQSAIDRATNKLGNDNKKLREQLEKLKKDKLSTEELAEMDRQDREKDLAEREAELAREKAKLYAVQALKKAGIDSKDVDTLDVVDFVVADGDSNATIDLKIKRLDTIVNSIVNSKTAAKFKEAGRDPGKGSNAGGNNNPYAKETFNLTEQMRLEATNPEQAKLLKAAAGRA